MMTRVHMTVPPMLKPASYLVAALASDHCLRVLFRARRLRRIRRIARRRHEALRIELLRLAIR